MYLKFYTDMQRGRESFWIGKAGCSNFEEAFEMSSYSLKFFQGNMRIVGFEMDEDCEESEESEEKEVGVVNFTAINLSHLGFDFMSKTFVGAENNGLFYIMDEISADCEVCYGVFSRGYGKSIKRLMESNIAEELLISDGEKYLICLDRLYINDEYRRKGVASFVYKNLFKLLYTYFNIQAAYAVGFLNPDEGEPDGMLEIQKKVLKKQGYNVFKSGSEVGFCNCVYDGEFLDSL